MEWYIWIAIGIICIIIEIFTAGFYSFSIGLGCLVTGLFAKLFPGFPAQIIIFSITSITSFLLMKRFAKVLLRRDNPQSNIFALVGKTGTVTSTIFPNSKGHVRIDSEEWSAVAVDENQTIEKGSVVTIEQTEGNKVIVNIKKEGD
jgi:hypothetical protein